MTHTNQLPSWQIGSVDAPIQLVEYVNLRCPDCKDSWNELKDYLMPLIKSGKLRHIIKPIHKEKPFLEVGNQLQYLLPSDETIDYRPIFEKIYTEQAIWGEYNLDELRRYVKEELGVQPNEDIDGVDHRTDEIEFVPTILVGKKTFVETIRFDDVRAAIKPLL